MIIEPEWREADVFDEIAELNQHRVIDIDSVSTPHSVQNRDEVRSNRIRIVVMMGRGKTEPRINIFSTREPLWCHC